MDLVCSQLAADCGRARGEGRQAPQRVAKRLGGKNVRAHRIHSGGCAVRRAQSHKGVGGAVGRKGGCSRPVTQGAAAGGGWAPHALRRGAALAHTATPQTSRTRLHPQAVWAAHGAWGGWCGVRRWMVVQGLHCVQWAGRWRVEHGAAGQQSCAPGRPANQQHAACAWCKHGQRRV